MTKPWNDFRLVVGYLPEIDSLPNEAQQGGLRRRVAIVLHDGDAPYSPIYWDLMKAVVDFIAADSTVFELDSSKSPYVFTSIELMREFVFSQQHLRPFHRARFYHQGRLTAFVDVEPWAMVGGPPPYSDSWTFAVYRKSHNVEVIRTACHQVCTQHDWRIEEEIHGLPEPRAIPRWKQFATWLVKP